MRIAKKLPNVSRRTFLVGTMNTGLVMSLGTVLPGCSQEQAALDFSGGDASATFSPAVWFEIDGAGAVLVNIAKAEMGQHVGTALARVVADELGAAWDAITIKHVDTDPKWGYMVTGGSWSVHTTWAQLCQAGAAGRMVLRDAGASLLGVSAEDCTVADSAVTAGEQSITFAEIVRNGDLSRSFSDEELAALPIKPASERRFIGKDTAALDIPEKSRGAAVYGLDTELPGMVYATPLIPPTRYGSRIISIDDSAAQEVPGYLKTVEITDPSDTIQGWAVAVGESFPAVMKAAEAIAVNWE
ncbi:MAG: molybdopterin cofactor-binding domain-containing protein, partial [Pseudomonadota bacterium]